MTADTMPLVVAIGRSKATTAEEAAWTQTYQRFQAGNGGAYRGFLETYVAKDAVNGQTFPDKATPVQAVVAEDLEHIRALVTKILDENLTRDSGNTQAFADLIVGGRVIATHLPATYLMTLELKVQNWITVMSALPVRSEAAVWHDSTERTGMSHTAETVSQHMAKVRQHKISDPTPEHPAKLLDMWDADTPVGTWTRVNFSGAVPERQRRLYVERARQFLLAVQEARVRANSVRVEDRSGIGAVVTSFLLDGELPAG